jgi:hypothetical protein
MHISSIGIGSGGDSCGEISGWRGGFMRILAIVNEILQNKKVIG